MCKVGIIVGLLVLGIAVQTMPLRAEPADVKNIVEFVQATLDHPLTAGQSALLEIRAHVRSGWHINSDRPLDSDFIPTRLTLDLPPGLSVKRIEYPMASRVKPAFSDQELSVFDGDLTFRAEVQAASDLGEQLTRFPVTVRLEYQACNEVECLRPVTVTANLLVGLKKPANSSSTDGSRPNGVGLSGSESNGSDAYGRLAALFAGGSYALGFFLVFLGGLALNLTPCVYPLVGVTVAYFGGQGDDTRRVAGLAGCFVAGLALTFSTIGVVAAASGKMFGALLASPYVQAAIAAVLLVLAAANFGFLTIRVPQWMQRWAGTARPGYLGALLMGASMGIVAAPCIGPFVLGLLLMVERAGSLVFGFALFLTLALGLGAPYFLLALAAGNLRRLPRSGEWLTWVEQLFGFVLVGLALYFLDPLTPDRMMTRILPYYAAGVLIFLGFFSAIGENVAWFSAVKRVVGSLGVLGLVLFLLYPSHRQSLSFKPFDPAALEQARSAHRPVLLDFSADWCIPCREMEATTFVDPGVIREAQRFERLRADLTRENETNEALVKRYDVRGVPTLLLLDSSGRVVDKLVGYVGPSEMRKILRRIN